MNDGCVIDQHNVRLDNGISLHYAEINKKSAQVILFVHGYADSWFSFFQILNLLPPKFHCYSIDLRGHGESDKPDSSYCLDDYVEDIFLFLKEMEVEQASFVGHSMGSLIVQKFASTYPEKVNKLVLISSTASVVGNVVLNSMKNGVDSLEDPVDENFIRDFQSVEADVSREFIEGIIFESKKIPAKIWKLTLGELLKIDNRIYLQEINASTLIIWGRKDIVFPKKEQDDLLLNIRKSRLIEYDAGHALHWEIPRLLVNDLSAFLSDS